MAPGASRRKLDAAAELTTEPLDNLPETQLIARVEKAAGNNLYSVHTRSEKSLLVELPSKFRSTLWLKRGGYVVVDTTEFSERDNKIDGEIVNVIRNEKKWRKKGYWPKEFARANDDDEEDAEDNEGTQTRLK